VLDGDAARALTGLDCAMLRPERIRLGTAMGARASGAVTESQYFGSFTRVRVQAAGALLQADLPDTPARLPCDVGDTVHLHWDMQAVHALTGRAA
jgi:putative spermidine/putrescine transport system ATP-binding protein